MVLLFFLNGRELSASCRHDQELFPLERTLPAGFGNALLHLLTTWFIYIIYIIFMCCVSGVSKPKVDNVFTPDMVLTHQEMSAAFDLPEYFFIIVAEVYSPGKFYWFLRENRTAIESLTDTMT